MDSQLLIWIVEHYSKEGELILDPMAGSGTLMIACTMGRDVVLVELENKFCKMMRDNWTKVKQMPQLGYETGSCEILRGDARDLSGLLVDKCIFSPPFADSEHNYKHGLKELGKNFRGRKAWENKGQVDKIITSPPYIAQISTSKQTEGLFEGRQLFKNGRDPQPHSEGQIGDLPYGQVDKIITSPPYTNRMDGGRKGSDAGMRPYTDESRDTWRTQRDQNNLGNLPYGEIDDVITSPPYEGIVKEGGEGTQAWKIIQGGENADNATLRAKFKRMKAEGQIADEYGKTEGNIGNLKSESYLEAMALVYFQCHKILKSDGLMILVLKNFIRNKQVIRLDLDTIKICEQAGFSLLERHYRKLPSQSFWRIIYQKKHPEVDTIDFEDVLVFGKANAQT